MANGLFSVQLNEAESLLRHLGLLRERNPFPKYSSFGRAEFRQLDYQSVWRKCYVEQLYDFLLVDFALLQFRRNSVNSEVNFVFYENPLEAMSYQDYLINELGFQPEELNDIGDGLMDEYEEVLSTSKFKMAFTPIRYDYHPEGYVEGRHPAAHVHFGFSNDIRICTKKQLRPLSFLFFILRQNYAAKWIELVNQPSKQLLLRQVRGELDDVAPEFLKERDQWEMMLQ